MFMNVSGCVVCAAWCERHSAHTPQPDTCCHNAALIITK